MKDSRLWASLSALLLELGLPESPQRVLIVEDDAYVREGLAMALRRLGHEVDAREGVESSELPLTGHDLAFLDHYFLSKTLTGVSLTPELRRSCPQIVIVGMSSEAAKNAEMVRLGANLGMAKREIRRLL
jgi:CheY-like chemotaxis protein